MNAADLESLQEPREGVALSVRLGKRYVSAQQNAQTIFYFFYFVAHRKWQSFWFVLYKTKPVIPSSFTHRGFYFNDRLLLHAIGTLGENTCKRNIFLFIAF